MRSLRPALPNAVWDAVMTLSCLAHAAQRSLGGSSSGKPSSIKKSSVGALICARTRARERESYRQRCQVQLDPVVQLLGVPWSERTACYTVNRFGNTIVQVHAFHAQNSRGTRATGHTHYTSPRVTQRILPLGHLPTVYAHAAPLMQARRAGAAARSADTRRASE